MLNLVGNIDWITVFLGGIVMLGCILLAVFRKPKNYPPGPTGLPIVGYTPLLGENAADCLMKMKSKYGPIMTVQMGMEYWIVLNDYDLIQEALVKQGDKFSGRSPNYLFSLITDRGCGFVSRDYGPGWKILSRFGAKALRDCGVGKKGMEEKVQDEMMHLITSWEDGETGSVAEKLTMATANLISGVLFGSRFEYDDPEFVEMTRILREFLSTGFDAKILGLIEMAPALRHLPVFRETLARHIDDRNKLLDIFRRIVGEHKKVFEENNVRDFTDAFLREVQQSNADSETFSEKQLVYFIRDLFDAGSGTTSSALAWSMLCFLNHPECQQKIHEEVTDVLGESVIPSMNHRKNMPYTCAFLQELLRHRVPVPLAVVHKTNEESTLHGYKIAKNSKIAPNIWSAHMDPKIFAKPEEFRPERFLDENGMFVSSKHVIPFSVGPRRCLGEQLAKAELFIFLTGIVQKFEVLPDSEKNPPIFETKALENGFSLEPPCFSVKLRMR